MATLQQHISLFAFLPVHIKNTFFEVI